MLNENIFGFSSVFILLNRLKTNIRDKMQLTPWQINVAHATPATPILNTVTNTMSMPIFDREEQVRKKKGVFESPRAENIPVAIL